MKVEIKDLSPVKKALSFVIPKDVIDKKFEDQYTAIGKTASIKGFRPGKAPRHLVKSSYKGYVIQELFKEIINETYYKAISENKIEAISLPEISSKELEEGKDFEYTATVETKPKLNEVKYKDLTFNKIKIEVKEDEIEKELEHIQQTNAQITPIEDPNRGVKKGDVVNIAFEGFYNNEPLQGWKTSVYELEIGQGSFLKEFDDGLLNLKKDDNTTIDAKMPETISNDTLKGKTVSFKVKINEIKEKKLPLIDDNLAKTVGNDNLQELKNKIIEDIKAFKEDSTKYKLRQDILSKLIELHPMEVPYSLIEHEEKHLKDDAMMRLSYMGRENIEAYVKEHEAQFRENATRNLKSFFIMEEIGKLENISVSEADLAQKYEELASRSSKNVNEVRDYYKKNNLVDDLKYRIKEDKTFEIIFQNNKIKEVEDLPEEKETAKEKSKKKK